MKTFDKFISEDYQHPSMYQGKKPTAEYRQHMTSQREHHEKADKHYDKYIKAVGKTELSQKHKALGDAHKAIAGYHEKAGLAHQHDNHAEYAKHNQDIAHLSGKIDAYKKKHKIK